MTIAPYGSWVSPITAEDLARSEHPVESGRFVGDELWWSELVPGEGGRYSVLRRGPDGTVRTVLPAPWNARTRVHEYGGGAWTATADGALVFAEFTDQRVYRLDPGSDEPVPLTPVPAEGTAVRYAGLQLARPGEVWCVRELHERDEVSHDVAAFPLDGAAARDAAAVRSVAAGSHFVAAPRISPDGRHLAWVAWEHPQMPWDGTELRVAELGGDGVAGPHRTLLGSTTESVVQPEWADDGSLYVASDRSGWWNLYRVTLDATATALHPSESEFAGPAWQVGALSYAVLPDGRLACVRTVGGIDALAVLDPATGAVTDVGLGDLQTLRLTSADGTRLVVRSGGAHSPTGLRSIDVATGEVELVRASSDRLPDAAYLPEARAMTFDGPDGPVHAIVYPPHSPDFVAPADERPPYVALVHGGPTAHVSPLLQPRIAYLTSRGIGVVDVNYGGSSGYGRAYRERLRERWGVVDVQDTVAAVRGLAAAGLADGDRLAIEGGSAGGWTVLSALTTTDVFACGVSYFGVAELLEFAASTHDFESRYLDGLIGPLPQMRDRYVERAPLSHVDGLSCPVLLLQGLDDPVVPPAQSEMFRDAMVRKGIPHAYRAYEGESHGFRRAETVIDAQEAALSFYGQVLGFDPPDVPPLELWRPS